MASEWIDRRKQEPPSEEKVLVLFDDGDFEAVKPKMIAESKFPWRYWMPLPSPPERMVTIEISEADAREFCDRSSFDDLPREYRLRKACRAALAKESPSDGDR